MNTMTTTTTAIMGGGRKTFSRGSSSYRPGEITQSSALLEAGVALVYAATGGDDATSDSSSVNHRHRSLEDIIARAESDDLLDAAERNMNVIVEDDPNKQQHLVVDGGDVVNPLEVDEDSKGKSNNTNINKSNSSTGLPTHAYLILIGAVLGLSSIGPFLSLQNDVNPTIKIVWRNTSTTIALFPLALQSYRYEGLPKLSRPQLLALYVTGLGYAGWTVFFAWSLQYTSIANAVMFGNCQSMLFLMGRILMGKPISLAEGAGAAIAFSGAVLCSHDSSEKDPKHSEVSSIRGDLFAVMSACCGVVYLTTSRSVRPAMNLYLFTFCVMSMAAINASILAHFAGIDVSWDRNDRHGIFGWVNIHKANRLPLQMTMIVCCQFFGAMGYIRSMTYFPNLVISVATLLEPVVAEIAAVLLGVGHLPGWMGWTGNTLVIVGTLAVVYRPPVLTAQKKL